MAYIHTLFGDIFLLLCLFVGFLFFPCLAIIETIQDELEDRRKRREKELEPEYQIGTIEDEN